MYSCARQRSFSTARYESVTGCDLEWLSVPFAYRAFGNRGWQRRTAIGILEGGAHRLPLTLLPDHYSNLLTSSPYTFSVTLPVVASAGGGSRIAGGPAGVDGADADPVGRSGCVIACDATIRPGEVAEVVVTERQPSGIGQLEQEPRSRLPAEI